MIKEVDLFKVLQLIFNKMYFDDFEDQDDICKIFEVNLGNFKYTGQLVFETNQLEIISPVGSTIAKINLNEVKTTKRNPNSIIKE